jgi:hypothetical protein
MDTFKTEAGGGIPAGIPGYVGGTLQIATAGDFTFTLLGSGDATNFNEFLIGGHCFGTANTPCGATPIGTSFTIALAPGNMPFSFIYDQPNTHTLGNSQRDDANGAYLVSVNTVPGGAPLTGPASAAYLGLTDNPYPADNDFQDLGVRITAAVPEPATVALMAAGLAGLGLRKRFTGKPA